MIYFTIPEIIKIRFTIINNLIFQEIIDQNTDILKRGKYSYSSPNGNLEIISKLSPGFYLEDDKIIIFIWGANKNDDHYVTPPVRLPNNKIARDTLHKIIEDLNHWKITLGIKEEYFYF